MNTTKRRTRRTPDQLIKDLEAKIEEVKRRAAQKKAKADPALRHVTGAVRSIDKALAGTKDVATKEALSEARASLSAVLTLSGVMPAKGWVRAADARASAGPSVAPDVVLDYIRRNPGNRTEHIAEALGTNSRGLRPAFDTLKAANRIKPQGKARATRYFPVGK